MENGCFTKHLFKAGCLGFQVMIKVHLLDWLSVFFEKELVEPKDVGYWLAQREGLIL